MLVEWQRQLDFVSFYDLVPNILDLVMLFCFLIFFLNV
jgi:hypothetical protein